MYNVENVISENVSFFCAYPFEFITHLWIRIDKTKQNVYDFDLKNYKIRVSSSIVRFKIFFTTSACGNIYTINILNVFFFLHLLICD